MAEKLIDSLEPMYRGIAYSPLSILVDPVSAADTVFRVEEAQKNVNAVPPAPNLLVLERNIYGETIRYEQREEGADGIITLSGITRGIAGTARHWDAGTEIRRNFTALDHNALIENIKLTASEFSDKVVDASVTAKGIVQLSTDAENAAGIVNDKAVTPAGLKNYISSRIDGLTLFVDGEGILNYSW